MNQEQVFSAVSQRFPGMKVSTSQTYATDHVNCFILVNGEDVGRPKVCSVGVTWGEAMEFMEYALLRGEAV